MYLVSPQKHVIKKSEKKETKRSMGTMHKQQKLMNFSIPNDF